MTSVNEYYVYRASCPCGAVLWTDSPVKTVCVCAASWVNADGTLGGQAQDDVTDESMIAFIEQDQGRTVVPTPI